MSTLTTGSDPGAEQPEIVIARLRRHTRVLFWPGIVFVALSAGVGFGYGRFELEWQNTVFAVAAGAVFFLFCFLPYLSWLACRYTLTSRRMLTQRGLFRREKQEVYHVRCPGIRVNQSVGQRLWRTGDLEVVNEASSQLVVGDVPRVKLLRGAWYEAILALQAGQPTPPR